MQETAQNAVDLQEELGTTITDEFVRLTVEAELMLKRMTGDESYKFEANKATEFLIAPALKKRLARE